MLKRFEIRNYKNFKDSIVIDFSKIGGYHFNSDCLTDGLLSKMIIYGRNATGKTNLGLAIGDITSNFMDFERNVGPFLNVDSDEDAAIFKYEFIIDGQIVRYEYSKKSERIITEELLMIDEHLIFKINHDQKEYTISGLKYIQAETIVFDRYLEILEDPGQKGTLPFIRWILFNTAFPKNSIMIRLNEFVKGMRMVSVNSNLQTVPPRVQERFLDYLSQNDHLDELTEFLNVMGVKCKLAIIESPDGSKNLYFSNKKPIPFWKNASSGTKSLYTLYQRILFAAGSSMFLYLDEFDAFYHYEMAENVARYLIKRYPRCQIIFTTHNTNLMTNKLMRPDCLFILSHSGNLTALCDATQRELREGHNLEKMYISGEFEKYE